MVGVDVLVACTVLAKNGAVSLVHDLLIILGM